MFFSTCNFYNFKRGILESRMDCVCVCLLGSMGVVCALDLGLCITHGLKFYQIFLLGCYGEAG